MTSSRLLPLPSTVLPPPGTGHQQQRWPRDRSTGCGGEPASCPLPLPLPPSCPRASVTSARFLPGCPKGHSRLNSPASASPSPGSQRTSSASLPKGLTSPPAAAVVGASPGGESGRRQGSPGPSHHLHPALSLKRLHGCVGRSRDQESQADFGPGVATSSPSDLGGSLRREVLIYKGRVGSDQGRLTRGPQSPRISQDGFGTRRLELWV